MNVEDAPEAQSPGQSKAGAVNGVLVSVLRVLREAAILLVVAVALAVVSKTFLVQSFYIPSGSMEPGLIENDRIMVQKVSYWFTDPHRGDVIVFKDPGSWLPAEDSLAPTGIRGVLAKIGLYPTGGHLVKRVIGLPGDTVGCCNKKGQLLINGTAIDESEFIAPQLDCDGPMAGCPSGGQDRSWSATVPADQLFVMGDNRGASADSSRHLCDQEDPSCDNSQTFVPIDNVVGKVFVLLWPFGRAHFIGTPDVFDTVADPQDAQDPQTTNSD